MYRRYFKRLIDVVVAILALVGLSPLLTVVALWLHFANKGTGAFFTQKRVGKDNRVFRLVKFKSMSDERDNEGVLLPDSERLTKAGKFVRKTSLDELPQLINVLKGDMSLIGPRPLTLGYYHVFDSGQLRRHEVRPGITGWAQVHGRALCKLSLKFKYDVWYVDNCSLKTDILILYKTACTVFKRESIGDGTETMSSIDDLGLDVKIEEYYTTHPRE